MGRDHSTAYAAVVGVFGIMFLLVLSSIGVGQAFSASLVGTGTTPGAFGTKYYDQQAMTTNYHMGNDPSLNWRWVQIINAGSMLENKVINTISMPLKTHGVPAGIASVAVFSPSGVQLYTFATFNVNTISQTTMWYTFRGDTGTYTLKAGDRIGVAFHAGNIANYLTAFGSNTNPVDSTFSHRQRFNGTHWVGAVNEDLTAVIGLSTATGSDGVKPSVAITNLAQGATVVTPFTVSGTSSDNVAVSYVEVKTEWHDGTNPCSNSIDCPAYQRATPTGGGGSWSTWSIILNPSKVQTVMAHAYDTSGNEQWSVAINVNHLPPTPPGDTTPPTISITTPANSASIPITSVGVSGTAADNRGLATITWSMDGGIFAPVSMTPGTTSTSWSFTALDVPVGAHTITVRALDTAGLSATSQVIFTVTSTTPVVCPTGFTWDPVLKVCIGNPADPDCPTGFTWNTVTKTCDQDDPVNPNPTQFGFGMFELIGGLGVLGAVIGTKAATARKR